MTEAETRATQLQPKEAKDCWSPLEARTREKGFSPKVSAGAWLTERVGWHHRFNGREFEQTLGDSEGQGSLACCSQWGHRVRRDLVTEQQVGNECALFHPKASLPHLR